MLQLKLQLLKAMGHHRTQELEISRYLIVKYNFIQAKKYSNYKHLKKYIKLFFYFSYNKSRNNFKDEINVAL